MNLQGEVSKFYFSLEDQLRATPAHPFFSLPGLISALKDRFYLREDQVKARNALMQLRMRTTACEYATQFHQLLDDVDSLDEPTSIYLVTRGLPDDLAMWLRYSRPATLNDAINLAIQMDPSNREPLPLPSGPSSAEPMDVQRLHSIRRSVPAPRAPSRTNFPAHGRTAIPSALSSTRSPSPRVRALPTQRPLDPRHHSQWPHHSQWLGSVL